MDNHEKVYFVQKIDEGKFETESLWCIRNGDYYIVDSIPFIAKRISLGDTIKAEYDVDDKIFYFEDFIAVSGNTTVRLYFDEFSTIESVREELNNYGCESEVLPQRKIVAVNVPKEVSYKPIKQYLEDGEQSGRWVYEESCLAHKY
jgi:hypothetical protein